MYKLKIDIRERDLIAYFTSNNIEFTTEDMDVADIIFYRDEVPVVMIERKTLGDLVKSILDKRYHNQKARLKMVDCPVIYLIEGHPAIDVIMTNDDVTDYTRDELIKLIAETRVRYDGMDFDRIYGMFTGTMLRDKMHVLRAMDFQESCDLIIKLFNKTQEFKLGTESGASTNDAVDYLKTVKLEKKANITPENIMSLLLAQIPGISVTMAEKVRAQYPSMASLISHYESLPDSERPKALKDIDLGARKLGKVASEKIYNYLYGKRE